MKLDKRLWNRYVGQLESAIDQARAKPDYDPHKFVWKGWECWIAGYRAGQKSGMAKAAKKRAAQRRSHE